MLKPILSCTFDKECPGETRTTKDNIKYCPECGSEDYSEMVET